MSVSEKWDALTIPAPDSMRGRMLADEELSDAEFERLAHRIALEAHEDRLKLWETALIRYERLNAQPPYYCQNCRCERCGNTFAVDGGTDGG